MFSNAGVLERHPQLLLLPSLPAAAAAAAEALAALCPRSSSEPADVAAAARAALASAPGLMLQLPNPLLGWSDLTMETQNLLATEYDEWDDLEERTAAFHEEWAGR